MLESKPVAQTLLPPIPEGAVVREQAQAWFQQLTVSLVVGVVAVVGLCFAAWSIRPDETVFEWGFAGLVILTYRLWTRVQYPGLYEGDDPEIERWRRLVHIGGTLFFAWLGAFTWEFYPDAGGMQRLALFIVAYAYSLVSAQLSIVQLRMRLLYLALGNGPLFVHLLQSQGPFHQGAALFLLLSVIGALLTSRKQHASFHAMLEHKWRSEQMALRWQAEKALAEAARLEAERSSRAKTQFFAAASHDLRQPLHALSLFAEALRERSQDKTVSHLVHSINASVDALEGLFSELMDISRIDAGGIDVKPQHFRLDEVFSRLRLQFQPQAFDKGLDLRFRGDRHVAFGDPVLVERVLQNLLSNAIRYTQDGGVLLACRARGHQLLLQVWDTGPGIPRGEHERIFDEFYQARLPGADGRDRKGLGLGLAIVKRLVDLQGAQMSLRSQVGRGTVFELLLPRGNPAMARGARSGRGSAASLSLNGLLVVVVEDDASVREALDVLLSGWGARVLSFESMAAVERWTATPSEPDLCPDLLIIDYRLEADANGLDAMERLRAHAGERIPAILVSGSTMESLGDRCERLDFHVLAKPVMPARLRAMISFKLGLRESAPLGSTGRRSEFQVVDQAS